VIKKLIGAFFIFGAAGMALKYSYQTLSTVNIVIGSRGLIRIPDISHSCDFIHYVHNEK
jgi:hypothetical protein